MGIAKIQTVKPKYSIAEVISVPTELARGMVLRRREAPPDNQNQRRRDSEPGFEDLDGDGLPDYLNTLSN